MSRNQFVTTSIFIYKRELPKKTKLPTRSFVNFKGSEIFPKIFESNIGLPSKKNGNQYVITSMFIYKLDLRKKTLLLIFYRVLWILKWVKLFQKIWINLRHFSGNSWKKIMYRNQYFMPSTLIYQWDILKKKICDILRSLVNFKASENLQQKVWNSFSLLLGLVKNYV